VADSGWQDVPVGSDAIIRSIRLAAASAVMDALERFYVGCLGFTADVDGDRLTLTTGGGSHVTFEPAPGDAGPFYHFALLVPGDRYAAARSWLEPCAGLLTRPGQPSTTFRFDAWDADACYFHDPAGNIVELIAHRGVGEMHADGAGFTAGELLGISEIGLVVADPPAAADTLASAGVDLWSGGVEGRDALAFIGRQAHTLILCAPGRPWLPTQRPAECHPVTASLNGVTVDVAGGVLSAAAA
jgi:catechol 2,3-dioxygenase-like lactoylglutathione lyase family enzyme